MNIWAHLYKQAMSQIKEEFKNKPTYTPPLEKPKRQYTKSMENINGNSNR